MPLPPASAICTRPIPGTGEKLPVIGLGTWQTFDVGGTTAERSPLNEVLQTMTGAGAKVIDSSPMYGRSEAVVGDLTTVLNLRKQVFLATKVWTQGAAQGIAQMSESLRLLQTDSVDLMQIHNLVDWRTHLKTLREWKEQKKIRYIGITHYTVSAYSELERVLREERVDFVQLNYSVLTREAETRLLPLAAEKGVAVLINRALEGGTLFERVRDRKVPAEAAEWGCTSWGQVFLKYVIAHPAVTCVLTGTAKPHHMRDNLGAAFGRLPDESGRRKILAWIS